MQLKLLFLTGKYALHQFYNFFEVLFVIDPYSFIAGM